MTRAPHDIVATVTRSHPLNCLARMDFDQWDETVQKDPFRLLDTCGADTFVLVLRNGQRVWVRPLREARQWRPHDCNRFTALPDIRHLVPAATRGHRRVAVRLRNGRTAYGDPSGFVWTSCGSATIKGWRPA